MEPNQGPSASPRPSKLMPMIRVEIVYFIVPVALHYSDGGYSLSNLFGADGQNVQVDSSPFCCVQERKLLQDVDNFSESRQSASTDK